MQLGSECRPVRHYWFTSWPDHHIPQCITSLLKLVEEVEVYRKSLESSLSSQPTSDLRASLGPVVVHCRLVGNLSQSLDPTSSPLVQRVLHPVQVRGRDLLMSSAHVSHNNAAVAHWTQLVMFLIRPAGGWKLPPHKRKANFQGREINQMQLMKLQRNCSLKRIPISHAC